MPLQYEDFFLVVQGSPGQYLVEARGPRGINLSAPFDYDATSEVRAELERITQGQPPNCNRMRAVGMRLFQMLFSRSLLRAFDQAQSALGEGKTLRLKLAVRPPELSNLPWELLYDPDEERFLSAQLTFPIVRFIESRRPVASVRGEHPLRILYVQANVQERDRLDLERSEAVIREALGPQVIIRVLHDATAAALREALRESPGFHLLHFDGHGGFDRRLDSGVLCLRDEEGQMDSVDGEMLATFLEGSSVRMVVLSSCESAVGSQKRRYTGLAQQLMRSSALPAVIAMQFAIADRSAMAFNGGFYRALAAGYPVDAATVEGRKEILSSVGNHAEVAFASPDWAAPVLFMRARDGYILPEITRGPLPKAPFMADEMPKEFVPRPAASHLVRTLLLATANEGAAPIMVALRGPGGYGKSTLAQALCHDPKIRLGFPQGILWVTLGENPGDLTSKVATLIHALSPKRGKHSFPDLESATARLATLLEERTVLLVIDDVWEAAHLAPFLSGGKHCARLITTRNTHLLERGVRQIAVDAMRRSEAVALLGTTLPAGHDKALRALAGRLGEWPLLLKLVNKFLHNLVTDLGLDIASAIQEANETLSNLGLTAFDTPYPLQERSRAAAATLRASLKLLKESARYGRATINERGCYHALAIFPEDTDIPLSAVSLLWEVDLVLAKHLCLRLSQLSLLLSYDTRTIRLHDVVRTFLIEEQGAALPASHAAFLRRHPARSWPAMFPGEPYLWRYLAYHLHGAGEIERLRALLLDYEWIETKLAATDIHALLADYEWLRADEAVQQVARTLRQAAHVLVQEPGQLVGHLLGRLLESPLPEVQALLAQATRAQQTIWLRPITASLREPAALKCTLSGHTAGVRGLAILPNGRFAISASHDHTLKVWNLATGQEQRTLSGHTDWVTDVAVTPDGTLVISSSYDGTLKVWELQSGQEQHTLVGHTDWVTAVTVTTDGRFAISASDDRTLKVWELQSGQEQHTLVGHTAGVRGVTVTSDGRFAISASYDKTLKIWNLQDGQEQRTLVGHEDWVRGVAVTPDGRFVISASFDQTLKVWSLESGQLHRTLVGHTDGVHAVTITPNGRLAISTSSDHTLKVWEIESGQEQRTLCGHADWVTGVAMPPQGDFVLSASYDHTLKVWDLQSTLEQHTLSGSSAPVYDVAITPDGRFALSASADHTLKLWNLQSGQVERTLVGHLTAVYGVAILPCGRFAISGSADHTLKLWNLESGQVQRTLSGHTGGVCGVAVTPDGRFALSASYDQTLNLWDLQSGQPKRTLAVHANGVRRLAVTPDGSLALAVLADHTLKLWNLESYKEQCTLSGPCEWVRDVAILPDGYRFLYGSFHKSLKVRYLGSGEVQHLLGSHSGPINAVAVDAEGRLAISASNDQTLKVWDLQKGRAVATFHAAEALHACAITADSSTIVAGSASGRVHILRLEIPSL
ncbi:MAG: CHAT domain-containing protein [Ardenticatenales bacterium]|nr:CHAT domain-containing protein [Ardenticatenales bacterium]